MSAPDATRTRAGAATSSRGPRGRFPKLIKSHRAGVDSAAMGIRPRIGRVALLAAMVVACLPGTADAACPPSVRADSVAAQAIVADLAARQAPGAEDARWVYERARRSCGDLRPARAIAQATHRLGVPASGRRARVHGVDLIGLGQADGTVAWRLDLARIAAHSTRGSAMARAAARELLAAAAWGDAARTWSADPTRLTWDAGTQSAVVSVLGRSTDPVARDAARRGARAFAVSNRTAALGRRPLLQHLLIANRIAGSVDGADAATVRVVRSIALRAYVRVRSARSRGWSRVDGAWSTAPTHRAIVAGARRLLAHHPHAATAEATEGLAAALRTPPAVQFETLPMDAFYPWPRDGAFDSQSVTVDVDKPSLVRVLVYSSEGTVLRAIDATAEPGHVTLAWDGTRTDGTILDPGEYRYNVEARDLAGNRVRLPGLETFEVARDAAAPVVVAASIRVVGAGAGRRAIATWDVDELHSPVVRSWLVLRRDGESRSVLLHDRLQAATVRRVVDVAAGSWTGTMVFIDGSGNRAQRGLGTFQLR